MTNSSSESQTQNSAVTQRETKITIKYLLEETHTNTQTVDGLCIAGKNSYQGRKLKKKHFLDVSL